MDKSIHKYIFVNEMKIAEHQYWQRMAGSQRLDAAWEISAELYQLKGETPDAQRIQKNLVRISIKECTERSKESER